jgi:hypothetical protein
LLDHTLTFATDTATLAIFDPEVLRHRIDDDDWWTGNALAIPELLAGDIALSGLGGDGVYAVRVTDGDLRPDERDYANQVTPVLGIRIQSGKCFIGAAEALPGEGLLISPQSAEDCPGEFIDLPKACFDARIYAIGWHDSPRWWRESGSAPDAPADLVVTLAPRRSAFVAPTSAPRNFGHGNAFLFDSATRVLGPAPGMRLATKVMKSPTGLTLAPCGPCSYKPSLTDYSAVEWRDRIVIRVISVDPATKTMTASFEEKIIGA